MGMSGDVQQRPRWTLAEAARRTGVSRATLLRRIGAGKLPGAFKTESGWSVGVEDLIGAGLVPDRYRNPGEAGEAVGSAAPTGARDHGQDGQRVAELERALAVERAGREAAERHAATLERVIEAQAQALRMLAPGDPARPPAARRLRVPRIFR